LHITKKAQYFTRDKNIIITITFTITITIILTANRPPIHRKAAVSEIIDSASR
jgi:hypothetical protein